MVGRTRGRFDEAEGDSKIRQEEPRLKVAVDVSFADLFSVFFSLAPFFFFFSKEGGTRAGSLAYLGYLFHLGLFVSRARAGEGAVRAGGPCSRAISEWPVAASDAYIRAGGSDLDERAAIIFVQAEQLQFIREYEPLGR